jgi:5-(carboxyamino)imidazole ribonucleotide mutase
MPGGIPVATTAIGKAGAQNAGLLAISILALTDERLASQLDAYRAKMSRQVDQADADVQGMTDEA